MQEVKGHTNQKRKKQAAEMQSQLVAGSKVMLHSGIVGRVVSVDDSHVVIETAGSKIEVVRQAIRTVSAWEGEAAEDADTAEADQETLVAQPADAAAVEAVASVAAVKKPAARKPAAKKPSETAEGITPSDKKPAAKKPASKTTTK